MLHTSLTLAALLCYAVLFAFVVKKKGNLRDFSVLFLAYTTTCLLEIFDWLAVTRPEQLFFWKQFSMAAEATLPLSWLVFGIFWGRSRPVTLRALGQMALLALSLLFLPAALSYSARSFYYSPDFVSEYLLFLETPAFVFYIALMVFLILSLVQLEATLAGAKRQWRWTLKLEIVGAGVLLAALIFFYSQVLLYRTINMNLLPVRSVALITALTLTGYSQLRRPGKVRLSMSRHMAYKSIVLLAVSVYLIGLGLLGEGMKHLGESFEKSLWLALAFLLGLGLVIVLLSEQAKRRIKAFLLHHFYEDKYDYRLQWLDFTTRLSLSRNRQDLHGAILSAYCNTFGTACAALFHKDHHQNLYTAVQTIEIDSGVVDFSPDDPFIGRLGEEGGILRLHKEEFLADTPREEFFRTNRLVFAVALQLNQELDGFIVLGRPLDNRESYSAEDIDLMKVMALQSSSALLNFRLADQLARARDMEAMGKVSAFVAHDIKNHVYTLSLMVDNAREYIADPEFQADMLDSLTGTIARMKILIAQLKTLPEKRTLHKTRVDLLDLAGEAADMLPGNGAITVTGPPAQARADREELHKVLLNLLLNALDAVDGNGTVTVQTLTTDGQVGVKVTDTGCGIPEDYLRHNLFQPFKTTKQKGMGIGLYQCKQIVEAHGGRIEVQTTEGEGTAFTVWLPVGVEEKT